MANEVHLRNYIPISLTAQPLLLGCLPVWGGHLVKRKSNSIRGLSRNRRKAFRRCQLRYSDGFLGLDKNTTPTHSRNHCSASVPLARDMCNRDGCPTLQQSRKRTLAATLRASFRSPPS